MRAGQDWFRLASPAPIPKRALPLILKREVLLHTRILYFRDIPLLRDEDLPGPKRFYGLQPKRRGLLLPPIIFRSGALYFYNPSNIAIPLRERGA